MSTKSDPLPETAGNPFINKHLVVLSTGGPKKQFIFERLRALGCQITILNDERNWAVTYADDFFVVNNTDYAECLRVIKELNKKKKIDGIITFWNDDVLLCSKLAAEMGLIGLPYEKAKICKNKFLFREMCRQHGVPTPQYSYVRSPEDILKVKQTFQFPVVAKPAWGDSSSFVVKVDTLEELEPTIEYIRTNNVTDRNIYDSTISLAEEKQILIEEYIDGEEVDVNGIIQNGRLKIYSVADNDKTEEPFFIETGFSMPSNLPEDEQKALVDQIDRICEILGIQNACFQFEAKSTPNGPVPIELNLRMGGDEAYFFTKNVWGVDIIENYVKLVLGIRIEVQFPDEPLTYCAGQDFLCEHSGVLVELDIDEKLQKQKYLDQFIFIKKVGDPVLVPPEGYEYLGWLSVTGDNMVEAKTNLRDAVDFIDFTVVRFHPTSSIGKSERKTPLSLASVERARILQSARVEQVYKNIQEKDLSQLKYGIVTNFQGDAASNYFDEKRRDAVAFFLQTMSKLGFRTQLIDTANIRKVLSHLQAADVDLIVNFYKDTIGNSILEASTAGMLDFFQLPFVGASAKCLSLCSDKIMVKKLLSYHDIPTPEFDYVYSKLDKIDQDLDFPLIVKPADTDNSVGISNDSVVTNAAQLREKIRYITEELNRPAVIEEFIDGYEVEACLIGNGNDIRVLPLTKISFDDLPTDYWHILPFEAKMNLLPEIYSKIKVERPAPFSAALEKLISELAIDTFNILNGCDYAQVEIRVSEAGNPYVIEMTPNPVLNREGSFIQSALVGGMSEEEVMKMLLKSAVERYQEARR